METQQNRLHGLDFARGMACLSMPIFHTIFNLYVVGLIDSQWSKHPFWLVYQKLGLGTFVLVSGMAFVLSTQKGINWSRISRRAIKLGTVALGITLATYLLMPHNFVRFGVIHFFASTIILASIVRPLNKWLIIPGLAILALAFVIPKSGLYPEPILYITGLMSERPKSMDYIPLMPWFGVFMLGMGLAHFIRLPSAPHESANWMRPLIFLGKHSLPFYLIHQVVVYGVLLAIAYVVN